MIENEARGAKREYPGSGMAAVKIPVENALAPDRTNWLDVDSDEVRLGALLTAGSLPRHLRPWSLAAIYLKRSIALQRLRRHVQ